MEIRCQLASLDTGAFHDIGLNDNEETSFVMDGVSRYSTTKATSATINHSTGVLIFTASETTDTTPANRVSLDRFYQ